MKVLLGVSKTIDKIVKVIGIAAGYVSILIILLMLFEVFSRRIFHSPTLWSYETVSFLFGGMIMLSLPYGLQQGVNVRVDVLYNRFSARLKRSFDIILFVVFFGTLMVVFTVAAYKYFSRSFGQLERSWSAWAPLLWPVKLTIPVCGTLMLLQGVSELIKMSLALAGKGELVGLTDDVPDKIAAEVEEVLSVEKETTEKSAATGAEKDEKGGEQS